MLRDEKIIPADMMPIPGKRFGNGLFFMDAKIGKVVRKLNYCISGKYPKSKC